jgi:peptidyl-prolyl cis-trans isomerase C
VKLLREPFVQFMFIGAFIYLLFGVFAEPVVVEDDDKTIIVSTGEVAWMKSAWEKRWNRPPTEAEFDGLIQQYIKETVLYREALTMGLNKHDQVIRRRLAQKLEFLAKDLVNLIPPTDDELLAYFEVHLERYQAPIRYTFTQVFIDPDKRGDATLDDAEAIKATLISQGESAVENAGAQGDSFMLQNYYPEKDRIEIQKQFGSGFTDSLIELSPEKWHGPVLSGYGVHLVYVASISEPPAPIFAEVRERVVQDWTADKSEELNARFYTSLRDQYTVVIEVPELNEESASIQEQAQ